MARRGRGNRFEFCTPIAICMHRDFDYTNEEIGKAFGCTSSTVSKRLKEFGYKPIKRCQRESYKNDFVRARFDEFGYSETCEFVRMSDTKRGRFLSRCKTCGYEFERDTNILRKKQKKLRCPKCYEKLQSDVLDYYAAGHSSIECAEKFNITKAMVQNFAKKHCVSGGMSLQERGEFAKAAQEKACAASAKAARERAKIRHNDKRIRREWRDLNNELDNWRRRLNEIREVQSAKRTKQRLAAIERKIESMQVYEPQIATCKHCGKHWLFWPSREYYGRRNPSPYCSSKCLNRYYKTGTIGDRLRRLGRADEYRDVIPLDEVIERDNGICYLCGCKTDKADSYTDSNGYFVCGDTYPTRDHVIPIAKGGTHTWDNVRLACHKCNSIKNDRLLEECVPDLG